MDVKVGIFLSSLKIGDQFTFSHAIKKTVSSSLISHMEMLEPNGTDKNVSLTN